MNLILAGNVFFLAKGDNIISPGLYKMRLSVAFDVMSN